MGKLIGGALAVVAIVAVVVVGGASLSGGRIKDQLETAAARLPAELPIVRLVSKSYERGLLSSTQTLTLEFGCPAAASAPAATPAPGAAAATPRPPVQLTVRHRIKHGPFPGFRGFGAAVIDSDLVVPEASRRSVAELFGDQAPVSAQTRVAFSGAYDTRVTVPAFSYKMTNGDQIAWQGLQADVSASGWGPGAKLRYQMVVPGMNLAMKDERATLDMKLSGLKAHGDMVVSNSLWLAAGHAEGEVETMSLDMKGHGDAAAAIPPMKMSFSALKSTTDTSIDRDLLGMTMRMTGSGSVADAKLERLEMQASMRRLHAPTYAALLKDLMNPAVACAGKPADPQALLAQMTKNLAALLPYNPEYTLDTLGFEIDGKRGEMSYAIGVEGVTEADLKQPMQAVLMSKAKASGQARLPVAWIQKLMAGVGGERGAMAAQPEMMNAMLEQMAGQGFIVRDGEFVSSKFALAKGQVSVNGRALGAPPAGVPSEAAASAPPAPAEPAPPQKR